MTRTASSNITRTLMALLALSLTVSTAFAQAGSRTGRKPATSAQGVMVRFNPGEESMQYALVNGDTYRFDSYAGEPMFENRYRNFFLYDCINPAGCDEAAIAAAAPPPVASMTLANANNNECKFLKGGELMPLEYEQMRTTNDYVAVYYYEVVPIVPGVAPLTNFQYVGRSGNGKAVIPVRAEVATQQAGKENRGRSVYSFSLRNKFGNSRVRNLTLWTEAPEYWGGNTPATAVDHSLKENCSGCRPGTSGGVDFEQKNQVVTADSATLLKDGFARSLVNTDAVTWNDDGGSDGSHLALAKTATTLELPSGYHQVMLSGALDPGEVYASTMTFKAQSAIRVITPENPWCE